MIKALFRKQFVELNSYIFIDRKTGKHRSKGGVIGFAALYLALYCYLGVVFYMLASAFTPLLETEQPWLYAAFLGMLTILYGVLGSAFSTYAGMYHAKDNDLLLSMPIPPSAILLVRVSGVAMMGLLYESMVWIPTAICRFVSAPVTAGIVVGYVVLYFVMTLLITVLSCFMGWVVALLASKFKNRSILTVVFALLFIGLYYFGFSKASGMLQVLFVRSEEVGKIIHTWLFPFYQLGVGAEGNLLHLLLFTLEALALLALTWFILTRTFIGIATRKESASKAVYKETKTKKAGTNAALLRKEFGRFTSSPTYMLNTGLGTVFLLVIAVGVFFFPAEYRELVRVMFEDFTVILAAVLICAATAMNDITAPSVSLEGKSLWILRSMPVNTLRILRAKERMHILVTGVPAVIASVCVGIVMKLTVPQTALIVLIALAVSGFCAAFGLFLNLKIPMMTWTSEVIPVKQGLGVLIALLSGFGLTAILAVGGYFLNRFLPAEAILAIFAALLLAGWLLLEKWLKVRGVKIFEEL